MTERQTVLAFASDLRAGDGVAVDALAAPGVGEQTASLFQSYPSALNAAPTCYGLNDISTMPAPLANLIDEGGPDQVNQNTDRLCAFPSDRSGRGLGRIGDAAHRVADLAGSGPGPPDGFGPGASPGLGREATLSSGYMSPEAVADGCDAVGDVAEEPAGGRSHRLKSRASG